MADLLISYARDGEALADKLSTLLRQEGFSIWTEAAARGPIQDRVGDVRAAVVIWSDTSRVSEWIKAEANYARGQKKLVQASVDGEPPPMPFDAEAVAPLIEWTGDETHPGWLKLRGELEALCRKRAPQPAAAAAVLDNVAVAPSAAVARSGGGGVRALLGLLVVLVVAGAAFLWMRSGPPYGSEASPPASQPSRAPAAERPAPAPPAMAPPATTPAPPLPEGQDAQTFPDTAPAPAPAPAPDQGTAPPAAARPPAQVQQRPAPQIQQRPAQARPAPRASGPRISRRNSRTMRLFCERAGRGTPQCREFQRRLRNQSR